MVATPTRCARLSLRPVTTEHVATRDEDEHAGSAARVAARMGAALDGTSGWTTPKVVLLVAVAALMSVVVALTLADRAGRPGEESVDVGFLRDMHYHHEQAIQIGVLGNANAEDEHVAHFALEAVIAQQWEIGYMESLLEEWGYDLGARDRDSMAWMNMAMPIERMPGIIPRDEMDRFRGLSGRDADRAFLELMTKHHRGGIHMARYAARHASDERVRELADRMVRNQTAEIGEYAARARALGFEL